MSGSTNQFHQGLSLFPLHGQLNIHQGQLQDLDWDTRKKIFSLGNNTWLVYLVGLIATNHVCRKPVTLSPLTLLAQAKQQPSNWAAAFRQWTTLSLPMTHQI
jgi:hypothetical protein